MNDRLKKSLFITAFALVVVGFFFLIWYVFFRPGGTPVTTNRPGGITNGLPSPQNGNANRVRPARNVNALPAVNAPISEPSNVANGGATFASPVTTGPAGGLAVNPDNGDLQFYDRASGLFYKISPDGSTKTPLTTDPYPDVRSVDWAPNGNQAILGFPDGSKVLYDFTAKKQTTLPSELNNFSFSPQSDQIAAKYLDPRDEENQWLVVSKPDGTQSQTAEHLGGNADKVTVAWSPNNQIIASYAKSTSGDQQEIIFLGANNENFPSVNVAGRGFTPAWSPDGRKLLYSAYSPLTNDNPHLYLMNGSPESLGTNSLDLGLDTSADKCAFASSGSSVYCAVPYYYNPGSGPQPELSRGIPDNIYRVDLRTGTVGLVARPVDQNKNQRFSAANLRVAADESSLFFTDAATGTIQRVQLR
ncbi:MAG: hypothetical protein AAB402_01670 [Patescibacteria group bacterium]